jgi:hypothetical protein
VVDHAAGLSASIIVGSYTPKGQVAAGELWVALLIQLKGQPRMQTTQVLLRDGGGHVRITKDGNPITHQPIASSLFG